MKVGNLDRAEVVNPQAGEDAILLRELSHRAGNDLAVALAAVRIAGSPRPGDPPERAALFERAGARLEASAELHRLLARPVLPRIEVGAWMGAVCGALGAAAGDAGAVELDVPVTWLDGAAGRRLVVVAAELVENAFKYALPAGGRLRVSLRARDGGVTLLVADDGPGFDRDVPAAGGGLGSGIVADLVAIGGGTMDVDTGRTGTRVRVELPAATRCDGCRPTAG